MCIIEILHGCGQEITNDSGSNWVLRSVMTWNMFVGLSTLQRFLVIPQNSFTYSKVQLDQIEFRVD